MACQILSQVGGAWGVAFSMGRRVRRKFLIFVKSGRDLFSTSFAALFDSAARRSGGPDGPPEPEQKLEGERDGDVHKDGAAGQGVDFLQTIGGFAGIVIDLRGIGQIIDIQCQLDRRGVVDAMFEVDPG